MTGRELKATIFRYLESKGWRNLRPGEYYAWDCPANHPAFKNAFEDDDPALTGHYCWHAALAIQIAVDEGAMIPKPAGAFEVVEGGRQ